ncbi:MAG: response regulator [Pseudomonadota bacterium]
MEENQTAILHQLTQLQIRFKQSLGARIDDIKRLWAELAHAAEPAPTASALIHKCHSLAGSAGSFGAYRLGNIARRLEMACEQLRELAGPLQKETQRQVDCLIAELETSAALWEPGEITRSVAQVSRHHASNNLVCLIDDDEFITLNLAAALRNAGYEVHHYFDLSSFCADCEGLRPAVVIIDMMFEEGALAGAQTLIRLKQQFTVMPAVIFISVRADIEARLMALKAGARRYFVKPLDTDKLISTVDSLTRNIPDTPYRVMIVDDQAAVGGYVGTILQVAGIECRAVTDPWQTLANLEEFRPDLLLMDVHMPGLSGTELAAIIRQDDAHLDLPILFFSDDRQIEVELAAMDLGGDAYIGKTLAPEHLLALVQARLRRAREIAQVRRELTRNLLENKYRRVVLDQHAIVSMTDTAGTIIDVNDKFCEISGYTREELIGKNHNIVSSGTHPKAFFQEMWETITAGKVWHGVICNRRKNGSRYWVESTITPLMDADGLPYQFIAARTDITQRVEIEQTLKRQRTMLAILGSALAEFVTSAKINKVAGDLLHGLLELTGSEFGFIGEILLDEQGRRYLKSQAFATAQGDTFADQPAMEFHNLDTLFGYTIRTGERLCLDDVAHHPLGATLPPGHLPMKTYLGMPIHYNDQMVGMYCLANRQGGYDQELIAFLEPFNATYGVIVNAMRMFEAESAARRDMSRAREQAERANRAKSEFLSRMSHELRTPLNAILGFAQILEIEHEGLTESQRENVDEIYKAGRHLLSLINEVLDLSRIEAGSIELSLEPVNFLDTLHDCLTLLIPLITQRNVAIGVSLEGRPIDVHSMDHQPIWLFTDRIRLKQITLNLLSNAVKYNRPNGKVEVRCAARTDGMVQIDIIDTGPGIAQARQAELFTSFNRLGAESSGIEGTGIGLVITKRLVELVGGAIGFESAPDVGSRFWIALPQFNGIECVEDKKELALRSPVALDESRRFALLYIEDNPANLRLVSQLLAKRKNIHLYTANHPIQGLETARRHRLDLILLDINLPELNGYQVLARLQTDERTRAVPVIGISANAMPQDIAQAKSAGFIEYIPKPIDAAKLFAAIDEALSRTAR